MIFAYAKYIGQISPMYRVIQKKLCFTFLLISQPILIVERVGYPQNWHGKRFLTICDSTFLNTRLNY